MASFSLPRGRTGSRKKMLKAVNVEVSTPKTPTYCALVILPSLQGLGESGGLVGQGGVGQYFKIY